MASDSQDESEILLHAATDTDIIFANPSGVERLRICSDGRFLVNGRKVATDLEVYQAFRTWMVRAPAEKTEIKKEPTVRKIVAEWVKETDYFGTTICVDAILENWLDTHEGEYDGLCLDDGADGCGCDRDDLMPCNENVSDCRARRKCDAKG